MSVIRRPGVLGQTTQRRIVGLTSALSAAAIEALTVGIWFALVAVESRTFFTAIAGLGVLLFGSLLRTGVTGTVTSDRGFRSPPMRIVTAISLAACWLLWLLTAESIGGTDGVAVAAVVLIVALVLQFTLERRTYASTVGSLWPWSGAGGSNSQSSLAAPSSSASSSSDPGSWRRSANSLASTIGPSILLAIGATVLLSATWFVEWSVWLVLVPIDDVTLTLEIGGLALGFASYGVFSFLAQQRRFQRLLTA